jgi:hypothetical protein
MEATKFNALGIASTKDMTSFKIGAKMCSVTFRVKANVPRSFPVTRTHIKGTNNCVTSNQRLSKLSNHQRKEDPKTKISERFRCAAFFSALRSSLLVSEVWPETRRVAVVVPGTCASLVEISSILVAKRKVTERRSQHEKASEMHKDGHKRRHESPENIGANHVKCVTINICKRPDFLRHFAIMHRSNSEAKEHSEETEFRRNSRIQPRRKTDMDMQHVDINA